MKLTDDTDTLLKNVRAEDRFLFACTRQNFRTAHHKAALEVSSNAEMKWDVVYSVAETHGVAPLVYSSLLQYDDLKSRVPPDVMNRFRLFTERNIASKERLAIEVDEILSFLSKRSIDVMLIKGAALDVVVYDQPWYTTSADVDLVLRLKREEVTQRGGAEIRDRIRNFRWLECDYFEHHDITINGALPVNFQQIWDDATRIKHRGRDVFVMSPEDMLISTCINGCRKKFFRLKALCDAVEIINRYGDKKWEELIRKAKEYDCTNIVYTALLTTQMTLGCKLPEGLLANLSVNPARAAVIRFLIRHMSFCSLSSLYSGIDVFGKRVGLSLTLPYATSRWYQFWRIMRNLYGRRKMRTQ